MVFEFENPGFIFKKLGVNKVLVRKVQNTLAVIHFLFMETLSQNLHVLKFKSEVSISTVILQHFIARKLHLIKKKIIDHVFELFVQLGQFLQIVDLDCGGD